MRLGLGLTRARGGGGYGHIPANYVSYTYGSNPATISYGPSFIGTYTSYTTTVYDGTITASGANPIGFDAWSSGQVHSPDMPYTMNITDLTVANNSNRLMVVVIGYVIFGWVPETYITEVTWAGNNLSQRIQEVIDIPDPDREFRLSIWDITGSGVTTGNNTLSATWGGTSQDIIEADVFVASYYNVTPGSGYSYTSDQELATTSISNSITPSGNDDLIIVGSTAGDNEPFGSWTHDSELTELDFIIVDGNFGTCYSHDLSSGSSTFNYTEIYSKTRNLSTAAAVYQNI